VRLLFFITVLGLGACKTTRPEDPETILSESTPGPAEAEPRGSEAVELPPPPPPPPPRSALLSEPLHPVRGGAKVLPAYRGPDPCKMALTGESPVAKACSEGGVRQAIDLMQLFVKRARAQGLMFECFDCHADEDDRSKLTPQAEAEFRKLLFLARPE
jgi:hypothetical protein